MTNSTEFTKAALIIVEAQKQVTDLLGVNVLLSFEIETPNSLTVTNVLRVVSSVSGLSENDIKGRARTSELCYCRYTCYYLMQKYLGMTLKAIGGVFKRDHSSVINGLNVIEQEDTNEELQVLIVECEKQFLKEIKR